MWTQYAKLLDVGLYSEYLLTSEYGCGIPIVVGRRHAQAAYRHHIIKTIYKTNTAGVRYCLRAGTRDVDGNMWAQYVNLINVALYSEHM